jgi:uncharacterized protein
MWPYSTTVATMDDNSLRRRLEALNRAPIAGAIREESKAPLGSVEVDSTETFEIRRAPKTNTVAAYSDSQFNLQSRQASLPEAAGRAICRLLHGGKVVQNGAGEHLRIRVPLEKLWPSGERLVIGRQQFLQHQLSLAREAVNPAVVLPAEFAAFIAALPERTLVLDLETCGLAGSALFLVGLLRQVDGQPTIELLLARNYSEESAVLTSLWQTLTDYDVLLTFNGKTFDWPMVIERSIRHRLHVHSPHNQFTHIDILHHARRRWRKQLPDCRLQTLEWHVCRRRRAADIPGHCIPAVYADYVRTGFERDLDTVLHHNALDLVTLFDLALRLAA